MAITQAKRSPVLRLPSGCTRRARRACSTRPSRRPTTLEPTVVDSFGDAFADPFVWSGTRDRSAFLAVNDAFDFRQRVGSSGAAGEAATMQDVIDLSCQGAQLLAEAWGMRQLAPESMQGSMANKIVPTTNSSVAAAECSTVGSELRGSYAVEVFAIITDGLCFLRVMAQIYLELSDYQRLADIVTAILGRKAA